MDREQEEVGEALRDMARKRLGAERFRSICIKRVRHLNSFLDGPLRNKIPHRAVEPDEDGE
jgi:hypothetical protein